MKLPTAHSALAIFLSAFLLFLLEPIAARQLLPLFGGSAAVWTTCLVFFQCALLAGYLYAHLVASQLRPGLQGVVHIAVLGAAAVSFGVRIHPGAESITWHPVITLLGMLTATIGVPFLALAASTPLLQSWQSGAEPERIPPWWLFAVSNGGSLLALGLYPTAIEAHLTLHHQIVAWRAGFCVFALLCGALALRHMRGSAPMAPVRIAGRDTDSPERRQARAALCLLLPACGSMMLFAVTNHLGENIAAIPLLWIIPLAAYLLSFVIAFASPRAWPRWISVRMLAMTLATVAYLLYTSRNALPLAVSIPIYTGALFFACLFCHAELYRLRPAEGGPTNFYLLVALGSAVGAVLAGVAAPNVFHANHDLALAAIAVAAAAVAATWQAGWPARLTWTAAGGVLVYTALVQSNALGLDALVQLRGFYGSLRVTQTHFPPIADTTRTLYHGRIQHGTQLFGNGLRTEPSSYYGHDSGIGMALDLCCLGRPRRIGVVGLGTGTVAAYGSAGDEITFYEIDPLVERLARALFTYLRDSPASVRVVMGDARLSLAREDSDAPHPDTPYDVLVLDAFSGDAIPVHLLTAQGIALYRRRLRPGGVLALHISSQYLDLAPELALQARNAGLGAVLIHSESDDARGLFAADWVLMSADPGFLRVPAIANAGQPLREIPGLRLWTDDYSSLLPLFRWNAANRGNPRP